MGQYLYNILDAIAGMLTEKGWECMDTYSDNFFEDVCQTLELLKKVDPELGDKAEKLFVKFGLIELVSPQMHIDYKEDK